MVEVALKPCKIGRIFINGDRERDWHCLGWGGRYYTLERASWVLFCVQRMLPIVCKICSKGPCDVRLNSRCYGGFGQLIQEECALQRIKLGESQAMWSCPVPSISVLLEVWSGMLFETCRFLHWSQTWQNHNFRGSRSFSFLSGAEPEGIVGCPPSLPSALPTILTGMPTSVTLQS